MRRGQARRSQHNFEIPGGLDLHRAPAAVGAGLRRMNRPAGAFAGVGGNAIDLDRRAGYRTVGDNAAGRARHKSAQFDFRFRHDRDARRLPPCDEFIDLAKRARMKRDLAMIERAEREIGCALQRRSLRRHPGRRARLADEAPVGLRIFVDAVAAQGEERRARRHLAFALVQAAQERAAAVELAAEPLVPFIDAMVGDAAQHRVADVGAAAIPDVVADRIAAARIADEGDARRAGAALQFLDGLAEFAALVFGRGTVCLLYLVIAARQGIGEIDRQHPFTRHAVRFHAP